MKYLFLFWMVLITLMTPSTGRALDWHMVLDFSIVDPTAPGGAIQSRLVLGADPSATAGFDSAWDTVAAPSSVLNVTFPHPEYLNDPNHVEGSDFLWRDIRGNSASTQSWQIDASSDRSGSTTTVSWTFSPSSGLCQHPILTLTDQTHGAVESLPPTGSYSFPNGAAPTRLIISLDQGNALPPPPPPTGFWSPRQGKDTILLAWSGQNESNLLGYNLFRRAPGQTDYVKISPQPLTAMSFLDASLAPGTYFYKIAAVNTDGCSSLYSNEISVALN